MRRGFTIFAAGMVALLGVADSYSSERASLRTVEGTVSEVRSMPADAGGEITAVRLRVDPPEAGEIDILLAPRSALSQTGFEVESGDRVRVRIFLTDGQVVEARKVMNISRGTMVRLRTLRRVPLWDGNGQWQGGPCRAQGGAGQQGGHRHRGR